ncbi:MAG: hypothetical protein M1818_004272 [Claussenomyces sp. TS43310]|nr:MAG: hypothetical protein M1818_004272 [Claussenomyces sp. TS43310]
MNTIRGFEVGGRDQQQDKFPSQRDIRRSTPNITLDDSLQKQFRGRGMIKKRATLRSMEDHPLPASQEFMRSSFKPGLPGLQSLLDRKRAEIAPWSQEDRPRGPIFEFPHIEAPSRPAYSSNFTSVIDLVGFVERQFGAQFDDLTIVSKRDQRRPLDFSRLLEWISQQTGKDVNDLLFVHQEDFDKQKDILVARIHNTLGMAYRAHFTQQHRRETVRLTTRVAELVERNQELEAILSETIESTTFSEKGEDDHTVYAPQRKEAVHISTGKYAQRYRRLPSNADLGSSDTMDENPSTISHGPRYDGQPKHAPSTSEPEAPQVFGNIADHDENGPIYEYKDLVKIRGGAGSPADNDYSFGAGTRARLQAITESSSSDEDDIDRGIPSGWDATKTTIPGISQHGHDESQGHGRGWQYAKYARDMDYTNTSIGDVRGPTNHPLAATFGTSHVLQGGNAGSTFTSKTQELDGRQEDLDLDVDAEIRENFLPIAELHEAKLPLSELEFTNKDLVAINTGGIVRQTYGAPYVPKVDDRVKHLDRYGNYIGLDRGQIKKRHRKAHKKAIKERDREMLAATRELRIWQAMSPEERAERLDALRKPIIFWNDQPGAAGEDVIEVDTFPEEFTRKLSIRSINEAEISAVSNASQHGGSTDRYLHSDDSVYGSDVEHSSSSWFSINDDEIHAGIATNKSPVPFRRNEQQVQDLLLNLTIKQKHARSTRDSTRSASTTRAQRNVPLGSNLFEEETISLSGASDGPDFLFTFDDRPELQKPPDTSVALTEGLPPSVDRFFKRALELCEKKGRAVTVTLDNLVKFTPGAIMKRVFGGIIQEIQIHPEKRIALVIFIHSSEASAFVKHVTSVKEAGSGQERRELQLDVTWYQEMESSSIIPAQPNLIAQHIVNNATRTLRLHRIPLHKSKETLNEELGFRLGRLLIFFILVTPPQRYMQAQYGRQAIAEFASIGDALEARQALMEGKVAEFDDCAPEFTDDLSSHRAAAKSYCSCLGCEEQRRAGH